MTGRLEGYRGADYADDTGMVVVPYFEPQVDLTKTLTLREVKRRLTVPKGCMWVLPGEVES